MALLAPCPDLVPESWLAPSHLTHPDHLWPKFDFENERTLVLPNPSPTSDAQLAAFLDMGNGGGGEGGFLHPTCTLPTPPHSPPTEHDLDDLVASIPEILESSSASPPSAISEILSDLEGMEATSSPPRLEGWGGEWWGGGSLPTSQIEASIKRDIMWGGGGGGGGGTGGGGTCNSSCSSSSNGGSSTSDSCTTTTTTTTATTTTTTPTPYVEVKKERQDSETSTEVYRDVIHADDFSDYSDSDDLPDTPSCTDSDGDDPSWPPPPPQLPQSHHHTIQPPPTPTTIQRTTTPSVNSEHNYCGKVPESNNNNNNNNHHHHNNNHRHHHHHHVIHHPHHTTGTMTPSDTEDEVDVVSCSEQDTPTSTTATTRLNLPPPPPTTTTTTTTTKGSADVKRQLQLAIQEAVRNRQNKSGTTNSNNPTTTPTTTPTTITGEGGEGCGGDVTITTTRLVSVKIKTQGKPAAYTKRMRDYHSEVVKSTKHRRRNKGDNDEGRRSVHNSLERQRRVDLRNAFEYLRQLVPDTKVLEKAPKVQILKKAALHCKSLQHAEQRLLREKEELRQHVKELQQQRKALSS